MDFIRRAWLFTKAKMGRTVLLIIAFSAILIFVLSGLIINSAANKSIANAKAAAGATVSLSVNMQQVLQDAQSQASSSADSATMGRHFAIDMPTISETTAQKIADLSGVKSYSFSYTAQANASSGITKVSQSSSSSQNAGGFGGGGFPGGSQDDFTISGTNNLADSTTFTSSYKLTSGRGITSADNGTDNVVIESTLASQNNLSVGSTFTLKDSNNKTYKMTIVGIFAPTSGSTDGSITYMNTMYTALSAANAMKATTNQISSATYAMSNPADADSFVKKANALVNNSKFEVSKDDQAYQNVKTSLNNVAGFARNIVLLVAIAGAIILALIVMLMVRERRFEIGVLMSLGESKIKIVAQFFTELFMVMIVSVVVASAAGGIVGNVVGQQLLKQETTSAQTSTMPGRPNGAPGAGNGNFRTGNGGGFAGGFRNATGIGRNSAETQALKKLNISVSATQILMLVAIAIAITLVAVGLASIGILRLNPKQVLTN